MAEIYRIAERFSIPRQLVDAFARPEVERIADKILAILE